MCLEQTKREAVAVLVSQSVSESCGAECRQQRWSDGLLKGETRLDSLLTTTQGAHPSSVNDSPSLLFLSLPLFFHLQRNLLV